MLFKLLIQLIVYTLFIVVMIFVMRKLSVYIQDRNNLLYKDKEMKLLEKIVLSKDKEIFLVQVRDKVYFLGASLNNVSVLKELDLKNEK